MDGWRRTIGLLAGRARNAAVARPRTAAGFLTGGAIALVTLATVSCQTAPVAKRPPIPEYTPAREPDVRVRVKSDVDRVRLNGPAEVVIRAGEARPLVMMTPVTILATGEGAKISDKSGAAKTLPWSERIEIVANAAPGATASRIRIDDWQADGNKWNWGYSYQGVLRPMAREQAGRMDVIEIVPLEKYLAGVLPAELPASGAKPFHESAFKAQAVAARSYALHQRARSIAAGRNYDLQAGEADQAYIGAPEIPVALKAARDTRGVVLTSDGEVLRAYYSSTCGGRAASAAKVWPVGPGWEFNTAAPLQGGTRDHACQESPVYRWSQTRDLAEMSTRIREWGKVNGHPVRQMRTLRSLRVDEANSTGRPNRYEITDDTGASFDISAEHLRNACNFTPPGGRIPAVTRDTRVRSGDMEMLVRGSKIEIRGRGFGHGVGMCQYCIDGFGKRGEPWQDMVLRFYPGAKLERAY